MNLSAHVSLAEFCHSDTAKRQGIDNTIVDPVHLASAKLLCEKVFEPIRAHFKVPIHISSGYRSNALNRAIKGANSSQHCMGQAMDIDADKYGGISNKEIFDYIRMNLEWDQLIWEFGTDDNPDWVHVSFGPRNRKQILRAVKSKKGTLYKPVAG